MEIILAKKNLKPIFFFFIGKFVAFESLNIQKLPVW